MAGGRYPPRVQGLVLGLAAAQVEAVLTTFVPEDLATGYGWQHATMAVIPLLARVGGNGEPLTAHRSIKSGGAARAFAGLAVCLAGLDGSGAARANAGVFGHGKTGQLLLPLLEISVVSSGRPAAQISRRARRAGILGHDARIQHQERRLRGNVFLCEPPVDDAIPNIEGRRGIVDGAHVVDGRDGAPHGRVITNRLSALCESCLHC